jgi:hypothetical protein
MKLNPMLIILPMMLALTGCVQLVTEDPVVDSSPPKVQPKVAPTPPPVVYSEPKPAASKKSSYTVIFDREPLAPERPSDGPQKAQLMDQEVAATGFGETIEAAKLDAVRNALSRSFDQFVFVERQIADDELRRDVVMSTMNGFVKDIELVSVSRDDNGFYSIFANVTVSGSGLENFIAQYVSVTELNLQRSKVNGSEIGRRLAKARELNLLEETKRKTQWDTAVNLMARVLDGYPGHVMAGAMTSLSFNERVPDILQLSFEYGLDRTYARNVLEQLKIINSLTRDSGRSDQVGYVCFSELRELAPANCAYAPFIGKSTQKLYQVRRGRVEVDYELLVPVFDDLNRYIDCISIDVDDGQTQGSTGSATSQVAFSRLPGNFVRWSGPSEIVQRINGEKQYFNNVLFLNGLEVTRDRGIGSLRQWSTVTKAYAKTFFDERKQRRAEYFYPFVVLKTGGGYLMDINDPSSSYKDAKRLCKEEGQRRHLAAGSFKTKLK